MSFLSFFPLIPATTTASAAPVYHGGMIPCLGDVEPVNTQWLVKGYFPMELLYGSRQRPAGQHSACYQCTV